MPKFEYSIVSHDDVVHDHRAAKKKGNKQTIKDYLQARWNEMGAGGWELVAVATADFNILGTGGTIKAAYYFKRQIP